MEQFNEAAERLNAITDKYDKIIEKADATILRLASAIIDLEKSIEHVSAMYTKSIDTYDKHLEKLQDRCTQVGKWAEECQSLNVKLAEQVLEQQKTMQMILSGYSRVNINNYKND